MNKKTKDIVKIVIGFIVVVTIAVWFISNYVLDRRDYKEKERAKAEEKLQLERKIKSMIKKWNAIIDWDKQLNRNLFSEYIYTAELQDILISEDKRLTLFFLEIKDIVKKQNNSYIAYFDKTHTFEPYINFVVNCNNEQYKIIISEKPDKYFRRKFAVIVNVRDVCSSPFFYSENYNGKNYVDTGLIPTVIGDCLDIIHVGIYDRDSLDLEEFLERGER